MKQRVNGNDASENALAFTVVVALIVCVASTWIAISAVNERYSFIGLVSNPTGTVSALVGATSDISLVYSTVDFGSVNVNTAYTNYNISSPTNGFMVQNDGSISVNVTIQVTNPFSANATSLPGTWYRFNATDNESGSLSKANCDCSLGSPNRTINAWHYANYTGSAGCAFCGLNNSNTMDTANVSIMVEIPSGEPTGAKSSTVTFTASAA